MNQMCMPHAQARPINLILIEEDHSLPVLSERIVTMPTELARQFVITSRPLVADSPGLSWSLRLQVYELGRSFQAILRSNKLAFLSGFRYGESAFDNQILINLTIKQDLSINLQFSQSRTWICAIAVDSPWTMVTSVKNFN